MVTTLSKELCLCISKVLLTGLSPATGSAGPGPEQASPFCLSLAQTPQSIWPHKLGIGFASLIDVLGKSLL